jgi:hypothetical protein
MIPVNILYFIIAILTISLGFVVYKYYKDKNNTITTNTPQSISTPLSTSTPIQSTNSSTVTNTSSMFPPEVPTFYQFRDYQGKSYSITPNDLQVDYTVNDINNKIGITTNFSSVYIPFGYEVSIVDKDNSSIITTFKNPNDITDNKPNWELASNLSTYTERTDSLNLSNAMGRVRIFKL